ncbi:LIM and calponin homology domains-containing protein 1-like isoform X5 [Gymnodraco acuticeps]|uniref:LIM and calponin homology domains-containing protein 1-like isoform X5 n=1 Tax=Gymnodraco acuticeps TaxID=8218 RepID=A0A6P8VAC2_GYMAC|nr:LIM and calponin homology domains-containing protein 1-like isoform X5 [Gymnodraco acuticeps]
MASPTAGREVPDASPQDEPEASAQPHPEPACLEAQQWIEAVTGKSFGEKDFRSGLENGILLCELLSEIKPGLVKKINRLPTPIAGLDNLSVFLRGCEELGLRGAQLFDPGDLQDTSVRANLKDSDCNRKLKNVLNTLFWLGKAASGCASYSGPTLNLKEFEGLLAQMRLESDESGDGSQKRSVRDSGYDCWDSERSDSLSPPQHTRDNSLDSLDSIGSRSQHSPSPDVVNRGNSDGRGSDSDADAPSRRPDVRKDDMLARRTASSESRSFVPFNQFLPNRTNTSCYIPAPRRKTHTEEGDQRSQASQEQSTRTGPQHRTPKTVTWAPEKNEEKQEEEKVTQEVLEQKKLQRLQKAGIKVLPAAVRYSSPPTMEEQEVRSPSPSIILRCENEFLNTQKSAWDSSSDVEEEAEVRKVPDVRKDDLASRRAHRGTVAPKVHQFVPTPACSSKDRERWEGIRRASQQTLQEKEISSIVTVAAEPQASLSRASTLLKCAGLRERQGADGRQEGHMTTPKTSVTDATEPLSTPSSSSATSLTCKVDKSSVEERVVEKVEERKTEMNERKKPFWLDDDDLPPIMVSRRVAFMSEDTETVSMSDILNEEEVGHLPPVSQSRNERMHEQYNNSQEDDDPWRNDLARWKNRRRCASQDLIKKEEERKRMEKRMKEEGIDSNKRKSIKTYKEIVEEKERREIELCEAYRNAGTPEEAAMVLQRYALRFTISDATLDSLKLPRSTSNSKQEHNQADKENTLTPTIDDTSEPPHKPEQPVIKEQRHTEPEDMETKITQQDTSVSVSSSSGSPGSPLSPVTISENVPPQSLKLNEPRAKPTESPTTPQKPPAAEETKPHTNHARPQIAQVQPHTTQPTYTLPSPQPVSPRPVPLLTAKPYCQPRSTQSGHKPVKMDGLVRVNGEVTEDVPCSTPPTSALHSPSKVKDVPSEQKEEEVPSKQTEKDAPSEKISTNHEKVEHTPSPQREKPTSCLGSAISSLIGGRNCTTTTIIVTELTHTEPHHPDIHSNGQVNGTSGLSSPVEENKSQSATSSYSMQDYSPTVTEGLEESSVTIETPMLNLAKRVNHWVWDPNEERKRLESWQQEQERLLQEQYQKEQKKLKQEWEKAQLEVQEEERKHNEEERKILEETVTPLSPTGLLNQQPVRTGTTSSATENNAAEGGNVPPQQNGQRREATDDQHESKLHFFQDSPCDGEPSKKQELWKTASLDRKPQLNQSQFVKRSESHDAVTSKPQPPPTSPQPPSPTRCVSGRRLCSGCSQPLGKGAAMIIDTLGLFFHVQCFKCAVCEGQLGDATVGTDVRIRNGLLSCHECYIASRGRGQPTTL